MCAWQALPHAPYLPCILVCPLLVCTFFLASCMAGFAACFLCFVSCSFLVCPLAWLALPHAFCAPSHPQSCMQAASLNHAISTYLCIGFNTPVYSVSLCTLGTCERVPCGTLRPGMGGPRYAAPDAAGLCKHVTNGQFFFQIG